MSALEIVRPEGTATQRRPSSPSASWGPFIAALFAVVALAVMVGLGFFVADARSDLDLLELRINRLERDLAVVKDRGERKEQHP